MPFPDKSFDLCWSNAVLEHVGSHASRVEAQVTFLSEIARVSKSAFVTTPNRWFPAEIHTRTPFLHWLPKPMFDRYLKMRGQEWAAGDYMDLLSVHDLRSVLKAAGITEYRIVRNRLMGFTVDFVVMFGERGKGGQFFVAAVDRLTAHSRIVSVLKSPGWPEPGRRTGERRVAVMATKPA